MNNPQALCERTAKAQTAQIAIGSPIALYLMLKLENWGDWILNIHI